MVPRETHKEPNTQGPKQTKSLAVGDNLPTSSNGLLEFIYMLIFIAQLERIVIELMVTKKFPLPSGYQYINAKPTTFSPPSFLHQVLHQQIPKRGHETYIICIILYT